MDQTTKEKLAINFANSWKMASNWVMGAAGTAFAIYLAMPAAQQQTLLEHLPVPPWLLPILATVVGIVARLVPQKSITPTVAAAKSEDAPEPGQAPPVRFPSEPVDSSGFPLATGPAPLPSIDPGNSASR